jgi:hypothetical protein
MFWTMYSYYIFYKLKKKISIYIYIKINKKKKNVASIHATSAKVQAKAHSL